MVRKISIDLAENGFIEYGSPVVMNSLTFGEECDMYDELERMKKKNDGDVPSGLAGLILLSKVIKEAPFDKSREGIRNLDPELGEFLLAQATELLHPLVKKTST